MSAESDYRCPNCRYGWTATPPSECPVCAALGWKLVSLPKFQRGDRVRKIKGSEWEGTVVGEYSTKLTPEGYCIESDAHAGSVQIYPAAALELIARVKV